MIDHLQFNKESYYPLQNLGTLVGKHVHPISKQILVYEGSHISNIYRLYEDQNVGNETIYAVEITDNGVFQYWSINASFCWYRILAVI